MFLSVVVLSLFLALCSLADFVIDVERRISGDGEFALTGEAGVSSSCG